MFKFFFIHGAKQRHLFSPNTTENWFTLIYDYSNFVGIFVGFFVGFLSCFFFEKYCFFFLEKN